jgi:hypothetical protein
VFEMTVAPPGRAVAAAPCCCVTVEVTVWPFWTISMTITFMVVVEPAVDRCLLVCV